MNCPNHKEQELARVYYSKTQFQKGANRFPLANYLYCETGEEMFKIKLEPLDSRPKKNTLSKLIDS